MDNYKRLLIYWSLIISAGLLIQGDPRIDGFNNENLIEYHYRYAVDDSKSQGPVMDRWEHRIGEYVKGAYSVVDPDGRVRTVDYEVDGKKGYHAVIRMNEPGPELLSYQQLSKSYELFPEAALPSPSDEPSPPPRNLSPPDSTADGKAWNYHSNTPYINQIGSKGVYKGDASTQIAKSAHSIRSLQNLPFSPANYNVPQPTNLIYFRTPAASIFQQTFEPLKSDVSLQRTVKRENVNLLPVVVKDEDGTIPRRRRNSRLVRRYKSFSDVLS